ncbi:unnamed protein product [Phyllotreta striolata]|uniref:Transmembrane protein 120 homolog n=1 Tax=Phyllotreta striolata TaxID=444603 RepID=A0A9N9XMD9_PHYSR|nr:unnamed protein product [Phyllotreta striolata]
MIGSALEEWKELADDFKILEETNAEYLKKVKELMVLQEKCQKHIHHQRYRIKAISKTLNNASDSEAEDLKVGMLKREKALEDIEQTLPRKSDRFMLKLILGNIDVSFLNKENKFKYKEDYENFKLLSNFVALFMVVLSLNMNFRPLEQLFMGFLIWYYCTISIRESILKVNGSRIKGWWRVHHLLSILSSSLFLIWPNNEPWALFRKQFLYYTVYSAFMQYLQFKYQKGTLYRLKALGEMQNMDITLEGFQSWMWKGLAFLLPFLFIGYLFQLVNAVVLFNLSYHSQASWEITALAAIFLAFFIGNTYTTLMVIPNKTKRKLMMRYKIFTDKIYDAVQLKNNHQNKD